MRRNLNLKELCGERLVMKYALSNSREGYLSSNNDIEGIFLRCSQKINKTKSLIDNYPREWEIVKKQIHEHEYVYTGPYHDNNISRIVPISRSYFKLCEIYYEFNILNTVHPNKIVCLAEAPGGFIQSLIKLVPDKNIKVIHGVSLLDPDNKNVPKWNSLLTVLEKVDFIEGVKGDGDLYDFINVLSIIKTIGKGSVDFCSGDGGLDYSGDYSKQEANSLKLIYSEIFVALNVQKKGGSFVCKIFDITMKETLMLIHILKESYQSVSFYKPKISRFSNSEKYVVCSDYKGYNKSIINELCYSFNDNKIERKMDAFFIDDLLKFNSQYCNKQVEYIEKGLRLIEHKKLMKRPTKYQIEYSIEWCKKYNIPINNDCHYL